MPRGPAPTGTARRRNAPTIAGRVLPAGGRVAPPPDVPEWVELGEAGSAWWAWAWRLPQAEAWSESDAPFVARRAMLEDDVAAIERVEGLDFEVLAAMPTFADIERTVRRVSALATGRLALFKEMRELDNRLGLNPKAMVDLRWSVGEVERVEERGDDDGDNVVALYS